MKLPKQLSKKSLVRQLKDPASSLQTIALTAIPALIYLVRAWPYFIKPQLYAEDGIVWIAEGKNLGAKVILKPHVYAGFYHYPERLWGYLVGSLPLQWAPAIFALTAWALFIVMTYYLLSKRTRILTNNYERIFMVLALGLIANFKEFFFNFSNSIFLAGIISILILVATRPKKRSIDISEKIFFTLSCLALPFSWIYLPIALWDRFWYKTKNNFFIAASTITAVIQALGYFTSHPARSPITLVSLISPWTLLELFNQIITPALRFARIDIGIDTYAHGHYNVLLVSFSMLLLAAATWLVLRKSQRSVFLVLLFMAGMTFSSLKSPTLHAQTPVEAIKAMAVVDGANRYFVYGIVGVTLVYIKTFYEIFVPKYRYYAMVALLGFGLLSSLHYDSLRPNKGWVDFTKQYSQGVKNYYAGNPVNNIPVNPPNYTMGLYHLKK